MLDKMCKQTNQVETAVQEKQSLIIFSKIYNIFELKNCIDRTLYSLENSLFDMPERVECPIDENTLEGFFPKLNQDLDILTNDLNDIKNRIHTLMVNV